MKTYTKKELIEHLLFIYKDRNNKIPSAVSLRNYNGPKYDVYVKTFGSWENSLDEAGFNTIKRNFK